MAEAEDRNAQKIFYRHLRPGAKGLNFIFLHGSGSKPADQVQLAEAIAKEQPCFMLRGPEPLRDGFTYFQRNPDRSINVDSLKSNSAMLSQFVTHAIAKGTLRGRPILIGFSAGAIMADALLRANPSQYSGAVLFRPMSSDRQNPVPQMIGKPVLILAGEKDDRRKPEDARLIGSQYKTAGAEVKAQVLPTGHGLHPDEPKIVTKWLASNFERKHKSGS